MYLQKKWLILLVLLTKYITLLNNKNIRGSNKDNMLPKILRLRIIKDV